MGDEETDDESSEGPFFTGSFEVVDEESGEETVIGMVEDIELEVEEGSRPEFSVTGETEFEGSFDIEVDEDSAELFETLLAGEAFESGMDMELAEELDSLIAEDEDVGGVPPPEKFLEESTSPDVVEELTVDRDQAETLLRVVYQKMNRYQTKVGHLPERLVLGLPQFKTMEAYTQESKGESVESALPVDEVIVVPGPQIHCVRDPYSMVEDSLAEEGDDESE